MAGSDHDGLGKCINSKTNPPRLNELGRVLCVRKSRTCGGAAGIWKEFDQSEFKLQRVLFTQSAFFWKFIANSIFFQYFIYQAKCYGFNFKFIGSFRPAITTIHNFNYLFRYPLAVIRGFEKQIFMYSYFAIAYFIIVVMLRIIPIETSIFVLDDASIFQCQVSPSSNAQTHIFHL